MPTPRRPARADAGRRAHALFEAHLSAPPSPAGGSGGAEPVNCDVCPCFSGGPPFESGPDALDVTEVVVRNCWTVAHVSTRRPRAPLLFVRYVVRTVA